MTIEAGRDRYLVSREIEAENMDKGWAYHAFLRPHGRSEGKGAGKEGNIHYVPFDEGARWFLWGGNVWFDSRAQVARAAHNE